MPFSLIEGSARPSERSSSAGEVEICCGEGYWKMVMPTPVEIRKISGEPSALLPPRSLFETNAIHLPFALRTGE